MTPTGVDPKVAAQRAKVDWDAAAEIQPGEEPKDLSDMVPPVVVGAWHLLSVLSTYISISDHFTLLVSFEDWIVCSTRFAYKLTLGCLIACLQGFSFLYLVSFIPVIIVVAVVLILFFNSLQ